MKEFLIRIRIKDGNLGFIIKRNHEDNLESNLELAATLDLIKSAELKKIGEFERTLKNGD